MKVFDIEDGAALVRNAESCTMCRECIRDPDWDRHLKLKRVKNHFIFSIETTGALRPEDIFTEAISVFLSKLGTMRGGLGQLAPSDDATNLDHA